MRPSVGLEPGAIFVDDFVNGLLKLIKAHCGKLRVHEGRAHFVNGLLKLFMAQCG